MSDRLHRRGGVYHTWGYDSDGVRWHESTHQTDRKAAAIVARDIARRRASPADAAREAATLADGVRAFLADVTGRARQGSRSMATVGFYTQKVGHWRRILGDAFPLAKLTPGDVDRALTQRRTEKASESTLHKELIALRRVLKVALRAGLWQGDPAAVLPVSPSPEYHPVERWLPRDEVQRLLGHLSAEWGARVAWIVATSASAGEADRAEPGDAVEVSPGRWHVRIRGTKTKARPRTVAVILPELVALLEYAIKHARPVGGRLFRGYQERNVGKRTGNWRRMLHAACARAEIAPCSENDLRRSTAQWLRRAGVELELVSATLGHTTTRMVQVVYGRLDVTAVGDRMALSLGVPALPAPPATTATHVQQKGAETVEVLEGMETQTPSSAAVSGGSCGDRTHDRRIKSPPTPTVRILLPAPRKRAVRRDAKTATATPVQQSKAKRK